MAETKVGFTPTNQTGTLAPIDEAPIPRSTFGDAELLRVSVQVARQHPRDEAAIVRRLLATVDAFPQFAEKALYSIPYRDARTGRTVNVEGLSVRAAETIAGEWGNFWVSATITGETEDWVDVQAVAFDAQKNSVVRLPFRVSRFEKQREGGFRVLDDRRFLMALQSGISKARRNAILSVLPMHVKEAFNRAVREALAGGPLAKPADPERVKACLEAFQEHFKVTQGQLEEYVGKPRQLWNGKDLSDLRTTYNSLEDGEATLADTFPAPEAKPEATPTGTVVSAQEGMLGSAAPRPPQDAPATTVKMETPTPHLVVATASAAAPQPDELARLREQLAAAEAKLAQAPAVVMVTEVPTKAPDPIFDRPAVVKAAAGTGEDAELAALAQQAEACATIEALDQLLGRMYAPGGTLEKANRAKKQAVLRLIGARRDALQAGT